MYKNVTKKEIDYICALHDPIALKECVFPENIKAPHLWNDDDCRMVKIRNYQFAWQNYSHMYCEDSSLKIEQNIQRKIDAGTCYNIGARNTGKSYDFIQMDIPTNIFLSEGKESCLGSATSGYLKKVARPVINIQREHPVFQMFKKIGKSQGIRAGEDIDIQTQHGHSFYGRNEKINSPEPGTKFHGLHYDTLFYEEYSYATEKGKEKRVDSGSSLGVIERFSGIPDVRMGSPLGDVFDDKNLRKWICRLPQYVRSDWNEQRKAERIEEYKSISSLAYKLNVIGEVIRGAEGFWDIERIKAKCLDKSRQIKQFDIDKRKFKSFEQYIILERYPAKQIYCCADIGRGSRPTEIIIVFYNNNKFKLVYNIVLNKLTSRETAKIFNHVYRSLGGCFIGIDATTDYGISEYLINDYKIPQSHIYDGDLRKNIEVGFEKNEEGKILRDKSGRSIVKKVVAIDWAMSQLEYLFYDGLMNIPLDNKLFKEFGDFKVLNSGYRNVYDTASTDDYHQAFQIFAICQWIFKWQNMINQKNIDNDGCLGVI